VRATLPGTCSKGNSGVWTPTTVSSPRWLALSSTLLEY
jgi:hypothetical protein